MSDIEDNTDDIFKTESDDESETEINMEELNLSSTSSSKKKKEEDSDSEKSDDDDKASDDEEDEEEDEEDEKSIENEDVDSDDDEDDITIEDDEDENNNTNSKNAKKNKGKKQQVVTSLEQNKFILNDNYLEDTDNEDDYNEEYDDDDDENYLQKFQTETQKNYITDMHPECVVHNYDEIEALCRIVRDDNDIIIDPLHKTIPILTKYERTRILGQRAKQINAGATPYIKVPENVIDGYLIAELELKEKKIPFIIRRPLPGTSGSEYWKLKDLELL